MAFEWDEGTDIVFSGIISSTLEKGRELICCTYISSSKFLEFGYPSPFTPKIVYFNISGTSSFVGRGSIIVTNLLLLPLLPNVVSYKGVAIYAGLGAILLLKGSFSEF